jgi:transposase
MAYKEILIMDIYEIIRRWYNKQNITHIAKVLKYDRKTVRNYINLAKEKGLSLEEPLPPKEKLLDLLYDNVKNNKKEQPVSGILQNYKDEIIELINDNNYPLKAKSAFDVIRQRHQLDNISYSTFKRFFNKYCRLETKKYNPQKNITCRIETPAGLIIQIDYAKMGLLFDKEINRRRNVYAFIATLANCRHKFIDLVYKQDQQSFVRSNVKMFDSLGGVTQIISIDNLKSGVIKPDLYDPKLNRLYNEFAEHYNVFIDPCRVRSPKDKGKVERDVQTIREQFRKIMALYPNADIKMVNQLINEYIKNDYGQKEHGTTGLKPYEEFIQNEKKHLKELPIKHFELGEWKSAKVHPDCFVQYKKKYYSVPYKYSGKKVWIRATDKIVSIYYDNKIIKQHTRTDDVRHTDFKDFPKNVNSSVNPEIFDKIIVQAGRVGRNFKKMIERTLKIHAWLKLRRAQGFLSLTEKYAYEILEKGAKYVIEKNIDVTHKDFEHLLVNLEEYNSTENIPIGANTESFLRDSKYYNSNK